MTKAFESMEKAEPTLFYVIRQPASQPALSSAIYTTLQVMFENSSISKQFTDLEKDSSDDQVHQKGPKSFF